MTTVTRQLASMMLELKTFQFRAHDPVTWASGYRMPVYNDNRRLLSHPKARSLVVDGFTQLLNQVGFTPEAVVGTATGGMAPATSLADSLGVRFYYVRSGAKDHGLARRVEGMDDDASGKVVLVEDLVSTGGSSADAAEAVHQSGLTLPYGVAVFSYGFAKADERFASLPFPFDMRPLVGIRDLLDVAKETGTLDEGQVESIEAWIRDPFGWGEKGENQ